MTTDETIAAIRDDLYAAEWAAFCDAMEATLPPVTSQTDPSDDADGYGPDGLTDGERGYREACRQSSAELAARAALPKCVICGWPICANEGDGSGMAHRGCAAGELADDEYPY